MPLSLINTLIFPITSTFPFLFSPHFHYQALIPVETFYSSIMVILSHVGWDHSSSTKSEIPTWIHPFETFCPSVDYSKFESEVIHPYLWAAQAHRSDQALSQLHLTFTPSQALITDFLSSLEETDYNLFLCSLDSFPTPTLSSNATLHPTCVLPLTRFISGSHPNCFV